MQILADKDTLVTASKDKNLKFWYPPSTWEKTDGDQVYTSKSKVKKASDKHSSKLKSKKQVPKKP
jgi:hypothetical protein